MITVIVQFPLPPDVGRDQAARQFRVVAPEFQRPPGLLRKYFLLSDDGRTAGGVYLWETRAAAERFHGEGFRNTIAQRYGTAPQIAYFNSPVIVDNLSGEIVAED